MVGCLPSLSRAIFASLMLAVLALKLHAVRASNKKAAQMGRKISVVLNLTNVLLASGQTAR